MSPEQKKDEEPASEASRDERQDPPRSATPEDSDPREEEGWSQPEASTQKGAAVPKNLDGEAE